MSISFSAPFASVYWSILILKGSPLPMLAKSSAVPPAYFCASPKLLNKKGILGSEPTLPLFNQSS